MRPWGVFGRLRGVFGASLGASRASVWKILGASLGASWGVTWGVSMKTWGVWGVLGASLGRHLGRLYENLGRLWASLCVSMKTWDLLWVSFSIFCNIKFMNKYKLSKQTFHIYCLLIFVDQIFILYRVFFIIMEL